MSEDNAVKMTYSYNMCVKTRRNRSKNEQVLNKHGLNGRVISVKGSFRLSEEKFRRKD